MAEASPKISFIVKLFMKYFISPKKLFIKTTPRLWERYYNVGLLEGLDFENYKKGGSGIMRLKNFKLHPLHCFFLGHFFLGIARLSKPRPLEEIDFKETKCVFRGDPYHEYLIKWRYK